RRHLAHRQRTVAPLRDGGPRARAPRGDRRASDRRRRGARRPAAVGRLAGVLRRKRADFALSALRRAAPARGYGSRTVPEEDCLGGPTCNFADVTWRTTALSDPATTV